MRVFTGASFKHGTEAFLTYAFNIQRLPLRVKLDTNIHTPYVSSIPRELGNDACQALSIPREL